MQTEEAVLDIAGLLTDGVSLSEALIAGDIDEGRFRVRLIAGAARAFDLPGVQAAAGVLIHLLGTARQLPLPGYAVAVLELSRELTEALDSLGV